MNLQNAVTFRALTDAELEAFAERVAIKTARLIAAETGETWTREQVAQYLRCTPETVSNRVRNGKLPPPEKGKWKRADVMGVM